MADAGEDLLREEGAHGGLEDQLHAVPTTASLAPTSNAALTS